MGFLRTLFWMAITVVVVVLSLHNWTSVTLDLFGGLQVDAKLPVLLFGAFALGFVPLYAYHRALRWRDRRRPAVAPPIEMSSPVDVRAAMPAELP